MGKVYKKKTSRKKPTCGGKKKRFSRRKMKGGVAFNTSFSTSSLPSSTYIPLNPNVNDNPSWNQYAGRLLPEVVMKGGKRTRKKRGGLLGRQILFDDFKRRNKRYIFNKFGYDTAGQKAEKAEKEEKEEEEKKEIRTHNKNIQTDLEENYVQVDGKFLYDAHIDNVKDIVFYEVGYNYGNDRAKIKELGTIVGKKSETYKDSVGSGNDYKLSFLKIITLIKRQHIVMGIWQDTNQQIFISKIMVITKTHYKDYIKNQKKEEKKHANQEENVK